MHSRTLVCVACLLITCQVTVSLGHAAAVIEPLRRPGVPPRQQEYGPPELKQQQADACTGTRSTKTLDVDSLSPLAPQAAWMGECCMAKRLKDLYLPGTHDSGTGYPWTVPRHLPFVIDEIAALLFNIVGDLSRTQHHTVYEQLQAGVRVLDLRLAVNPWIVAESRASRITAESSTAARSGQSAARQLQNERRIRMMHHQVMEHSTAGPGQIIPVGISVLSAGRLNLSRLSTLGLEDLQVSTNHTAALALGSWTAAELSSALVISHSLPGVRLTELLADVRRFLQQHPTEVVTLLIKGDTVDVNVASIQRMNADAWAAAAEVFKQELQGVQLLNEEQVELQTLGEISSQAPAGSVIVYSSELQQQGLTALTSRQLQILESWFNGTNTEEVPDLKAKLIEWMSFWYHAGWRHTDTWRDNRRPFMLLASAEITLGVKTILQLIRNRLWMIQQHYQHQQLQHLREQTTAAHAADNIQRAERYKVGCNAADRQQKDHHDHHYQQQQQQSQPAAVAPTVWWSKLFSFNSWLEKQQSSRGSWQTQQQQLLPEQSATAAALAEALSLLQIYANLSRELGVMRTLYDLGVAANKQLLTDVLLNDQVPKAFNIWSLDALSSDIVSYVINLNMVPEHS